MANKATIIFTDGKQSFSPAVYLHWSGGPESVYAFLEELNRRKVRADQEYECARFIQLIGEFFDKHQRTDLSLGVINGPKSDAPDELYKVEHSDGDNGIYLVNRTNGNMMVRRFREDWDHHTLVEFTPDHVEAERQQADEHKYRPEFRKFYTKDGKEIVG